MAKKSNTRKPAVRTFDGFAALGKLPPQALDLEEGILGACLLEKEAITIAIKILREDSFYTNSNTKIFGAITEMYNMGEPIELLSVTNKCKSLGVLDEIGGPYYLTQLMNRVASAANLEFWCYKLEEFAIRRRMIRINLETLKDCYDDSQDVFKIVDTHQKAIDSGAVYVSGNAPEAHIRTKSTFEIIHKVMDSNEILGATSGIPELDATTGGWMEGDLVVIAGRPGMGKTAVVLHTCYHSNKKVALFELEMSEYQVTTRELAMFSGVSMELIKTGKLSKQEYEAICGAKNYIDAKNVLIDCGANLDITKLRAKLWDYIQKYGIGLAIIDYLQLMNIEEDNQRNDNYALSVAKVTRAIKLMAKQFKIPIILLSQLNRAVETRAHGNKRPQLSDLRDSGAIEQDADSVIFLYREAYYNDKAEDEGGKSMKNIIEFIIAKNRQGRLGPVETGYDPATNNFGDAFKYPEEHRVHNFRPL